MLYGQYLNSHKIFQATCKESDQTAHMARLILGFAGRTYHIAGNLISRLKCSRDSNSQILYQLHEITIGSDEQLVPKSALSPPPPLSLSLFLCGKHLLECQSVRFDWAFKGC